MDNTNTTKPSEDKINEVLLSDKRQFSFTVSHEDEFGNKYSGKFISKLPSVREMIQIGVDEANMLAGVLNVANIQVEISNLAVMMATLKNCLVDTPDWFKLEDSHNMELIEKVFLEHTRVVSHFSEKCQVNISKECL